MAVRWSVPAVINRRLLICSVSGFSSGLPLFVLMQLVPAWLRTQGVDLKVIGLLTLLQLPYTWKVLWSPFIDRFKLTGLGRRRSWMLIMQSILVFTIGALGFIPINDLPAPPHDLASAFQFLLHPMPLFALLTALCSATGDIAVDAYRRELLLERELGLGNSVFVAAYRIAGLVPGSLSLILADRLPWSQVFVITALFMVPGLILSMVISEPESTNSVPRTLRAATIEPMREFLGRAGWQKAAWVLGFMVLYKLGDMLCVSLATPFYLDMGYSKTEIGVVAKNAGLWPSIIGGLLGGAWMVRLGIARALWIFGGVQMLSILGFAWLAATIDPQSPLADATVPPYVTDLVQLLDSHLQISVTPTNMLRWLRLAAVVGLEAFGVGVGTAAFVAFMAAQTNKSYTGTQYALFSSLTAIPRTFTSASAGYIVDAIGWTHFFLLCFVLAVPGMLILLKVAPWNSAKSPSL